MISIYFEAEARCKIVLPSKSGILRFPSFFLRSLIKSNYPVVAKKQPKFGIIYLFIISIF